MLDALEMGRPKKYDYPPNMTFDRQSNRWIVRNPESGAKKKFGDEGAALRAVKALNLLLAEHRRLDSIEHGRPTIAGLVAKWEHDKLRFMPWDDGTRKNMVAKMHRIARELGERTIRQTDCLFLEEWVSGFCETADAFNKWRYALVLLWRFAVSRKLAEACEPEKIEYRSTSKKIDANRKVRQPLELDAFWEIHAEAEPWLQVAMELSLVTLQGRNEVCGMKHEHFHDGHIFVIRKKVSGESDSAFIKIEITEQLEEIRTRSLRAGSVTHLPKSRPFLVHRLPGRDRREWIEGKPHKTCVNPDYLSKAFAEARDRLKRFADMPEAERPSFHEIRGLGSREYEKQGRTKAQIAALMAHAKTRTTEIYLQGGSAALRDEDYIAVQAPMRITEALK